MDISTPRATSSALPSDDTAPYISPLQNLPDHILERIFSHLSLQSLLTTKAISPYFNAFIKNSSLLTLQIQLYSSHLLIPPAVRAQYTARALLDHIQSRESRFTRIDPSKSYRVNLDNDEGRLYEYLEGVLMRGSGFPTRSVFNPFGRRGLPVGATIYDLTARDEWEDITEGGDVESDDEPSTSTFPSGPSSSSQLHPSHPHPHPHPYNTRSRSTREETPEIIMLNSEHDDDQSQYKKKTYAFDFQIKDFTHDPGQGLLVVVQATSSVNPNRTSLHLHLLSLTTFEPHPEAHEDTDGRKGYLGNVLVSDRELHHLTFQICDDQIIIYSTHGWMQENPGNHPETNMGSFNWKTGEFLFQHNSHFEPNVNGTGVIIDTMEDFVLLTPRLYAVAEFHITHIPEADEGYLPTLNVYELVENLVGEEDEVEEAMERGGRGLPRGVGYGRRPKYKHRLVRKFALPKFKEVPGITIRSDPPPRQSFPKSNPLKTYPDPSTGIIILQFECPAIDDENGVLFHMFIRKQDILSFLARSTAPAPPTVTASSAVTQDEAVPFSVIAPYCRFMDDIDRQGWVCFVYHHRFVSIRTEYRVNAFQFIGTNTNTGTYIRLYDFNPNEAKKMIGARKRDWNAGRRTWEDFGGRQYARYEDDPAFTQEPGEGDDVDLKNLQGMGSDHRFLVTREEYVEDDEILVAPVTTGSKMPYVWTETIESRRCHGVMVDDSRIVCLTESNALEPVAHLEVMEMVFDRS